MPIATRVTTLPITQDELEPYELKGSRTVLRGVGRGNVPRLLDSDLIFALFDLLGMDFCPRIGDIKDQRLCKIKDREWEYTALKLTGRVNPDYLKQHFDELLRVAASIKYGRVTTSLLISKLQSYPRQNNLMYVLQAYGQLVKTIFILKYLLSMPLRRKINTQLIKGEQLHNLRLYLWFGGDGVVLRKQEEQRKK